jgi:Ca2+-binding EF-hand superfamily protein
MKYFLGSIALSVVVGIAHADPPPLGVAPIPTAKGITPGGRGPARPRGEAFAATPPAQGRAVLPVFPPFTGGPGLAPQPPVELALFGKTRPIHIRVVTLVNGKSLAEAWDEHLKMLFAAFDRNGDGFLNRYEFEFVFSPVGVARLLQGKAYVPYQDGDPGPDFDAADKDKDGRISFAEFRAYYCEAVKAVVTVETAAAENNESVKRSQAIFELLDRNKDGTLTADKCKDVRDLIKTYDKNDDEMLGPEELPKAVVLPLAKIGRIRTGPVAEPLVAAAGQLPDSVADLFLRHYDKNKDGVLTIDELDLALVAKLDQDGDGKLTRDELLAWRAGEPDLIVTLSVGTKPDECAATVTGPGGAALPAWAAVTTVAPGHVVLRADGRVVEFTAPVRPNHPVELDSGADVAWPANGPKGRPAVIREADLANYNQVFRVMFDHMDFDGDGVLTYAEYQRYMALQQTTAGFPVTVTTSTRPVDLFKLLDENGDGKLSARELRTAYDKLLPLEPSGGPAVTPAALTPTAMIRATRPAGSRPAPPPPGPGAEPVDTSVPLWFRKMDVNNDGEVSKKEFLGSAEQFKMLDTNGDGVISIEEAKAYEAKRKK